MIGRINFFKVKGSRSTNEYPMLFNASQESLKDNVHTVGNVTKGGDVKGCYEFTRDLIQTITVPYFEDYQEYSIVSMDEANTITDTDTKAVTVNSYHLSSDFYWITGYSLSSNAGKAITFNIEWNGPTSLNARLREYAVAEGKSANMLGMWRNHPAQLNPNLRVQPVSGESIIQKVSEFPYRMNDWTDADGVVHRMAWVTFTTTSTCNTFFGDGGDRSLVNKNPGNNQQYTRGGQTITPYFGGTFELSADKLSNYIGGVFDVIWKIENDEIKYNCYGYIGDDVPGYNIYGFPILMDQFDTPSSTVHVGVATFSDTGAIFIRNAPTVWDVMSNQGALGFTAGDIVDVSISYSCPFAIEYVGVSADNVTGDMRPVYTMRIDPDKAITGLLETDISESKTGYSATAQDGTITDNVDGTEQTVNRFKYRVGTTTRYFAAYRPKNSVVFAAYEPNNDESINGFFICRGYTGAGNGDQRDFLQGNIPSETSYTSNSLTIDSRYEQTVAVRGYNGIVNQEIPLDLFTIDSDDDTKMTVTYEVHVHCDYDGMFTHLIAGNMQYAWNEPKLPWTASQWQEYKARQMADDRNAVISNLAFNIAGTALGAGLGVAGMGAIGTIAGGAEKTGMIWTYAGRGNTPGMGGSIYALNPNDQGAGIARNQLIGNAGQQAGSGLLGAVQAAYGQHVKERQIQRMPAQSCNMGYGLSEIIISREYPPGFVVMYPRGTDDQIETFIARNGFPVQMYHYETEFEAGFYQGIVYSNPEIMTGIELDNANNAFMNGVLFVNIEE